MTHPRPQLKRAAWRDLNGPWNCAFTDARTPAAVTFDRQITVPYAPESPRSGVNDPAPHPVVWYRRDLTLEAADTPGDGERLLLHFGAVDWDAQVWVNGVFVGAHAGGYTPFTLDITDALNGPDMRVEVRAADDHADMGQPRGKQDWLPEGTGHGIWYPRTSGIWQTVWLERVSAARVLSVRWTPDVATLSLTLTVTVTQEAVGGRLGVNLSMNGETLADESSALTGTTVTRTVSLPDPGIDDARDLLLWSPEHPQLIDAALTVSGADGAAHDRVHSYTALRSVGLDGGHFLLNGRPYPLHLALDQGYWPDGGMTATSEELRADVELARRLGFNGVRKHQKIESPTWLEWCDRVGLLVWEELPSAYAFTPRSVSQLTQTWLEAIERDYSHPCIVAWVPFNESWGVPDLPLRPEQRALVQGLYSLTRSLDTTRPAIGNDGWEHVAGDLLTIHDYAADTDVLRQRYGQRDALGTTLEDYRSAGRRLTLPGYDPAGKPVILSEFGGIAYNADGTAGWGYSEAGDEASFLERYRALMATIHDCRMLAGFCYTQLTDTYQEINGLTTLARTPKADVTALAAATRGRAVDSENPLGYHRRWLARLSKEPAGAGG
ncbi:beta-galactosidase/beta-glucuronidase [Deinococcus metalli]|uniref:Beta-galactosidase n=1 Tax=Deinococcus metalli TaxID=1141878 RepID=A0A7W8NP78_9DEIO|nr:glycoside hydrolase family 2 TIM barrel-domain containing protein [Deinococcus metalli]MBB5377704.1 beta-galactosidase/beta-glucuronidase [Deinococcus metalli]GHF52694.1 beta-galactosidase [Deinococcus metalli]